MGVKELFLFVCFFACSLYRPQIVSHMPPESISSDVQELKSSFHHRFEICSWLKPWVLNLWIGSLDLHYVRLQSWLSHPDFCDSILIFSPFFLGLQNHSASPLWCAIISFMQNSSIAVSEPIAFFLNQFFLIQNPSINFTFWNTGALWLSVKHLPLLKMLLYRLVLKFTDRWHARDVLVSPPCIIGFDNIVKF